MVALLLQNDLRDELEEITKNLWLKDCKSKKTLINVYEQFLPLQLNKSKDAPFPFIVIKVDSGEINEENNIVKTLLYFGVIDEDEQKQGYKDVLVLIQKIYERFAKNPVLNNKYRMQPEIKWRLQDEDLYPHYFGGMEMDWMIASIKKEDPYT